MNLPERRPKVAEVAARAGVSTATVDRVINGRGGVHLRTVARVEAAIREMIVRPDLAPTSARSGTLHVILAGDGSQVTKSLAHALVDDGCSRGTRVSVEFVERMNPSALARSIHACVEQSSSGVIVQALDHILVREAFAHLRNASIPVVNVLTDMAGIDRIAYVGLDNRAAGRTAGHLMARFCRPSGKLAVVWGGQLYRSHEERESGFRSVLRAERPDLQCLDVITGNDDPSIARLRTEDAISAHGDLAGVYCVGGGITGVAEAIEQAGLAHQLVMIGHNFNSDSRPYLLSGTIDALIHQDTKRIAIGALNALLAPPAAAVTLVPIEIITRENAHNRLGSGHDTEV